MITQRKDGSDINQTKIIDQIRCLSIDMINEAKSGHPGICLGAAPIIYTLYAHHLNFDVTNPKFYNRDRFVMSAGHGSALLYSTLYMAGFPIELEDLKQFRKLDSITPGHPEYGVTPGVDMTTGPLGQGIASAVGMAISEAYLRSKYTTDTAKLVDHYTYVLCGDGDLMEGVSYEALSLAGTLKLNKLIVLYDSNDICLDGKTNQTFTENISMRFVSMGWNVITISDGENYEQISKAIEDAKKSDKPTLIEVKTVIGKYSALQGTSKAHGSPLAKEDITNIKEKLGVRDIPFTVSQTAIDDIRYIIEERCSNLSEKYNELIDSQEESIRKELKYLTEEDKTIILKDLIYNPPENNEEAPRVTSGKVLNSIVNNNPFVLGGSADLFSANKTYITDGGDFSSDNYSGKNIFFGVREHAMGAILNGMALSGLRPYGSTFLSFSDYLRPSMRLACMMNLPITYIFTHDSISVGEDGPTHQPVEQLLTLRSMPNLDVFRPADINEVIGTYKTIYEKTSSPAAICLSRNSLPILEGAKSSEVEKGGYVIYDPQKKADGIIISSGEEVSTSIEVAKRLKVKGIEVRVVSMPNLNRFLSQTEEYIDEVLPVEVRKIVIETSPSYSWNSLIYNDKYLITQEEFGTSANKNDVFKKYGFDVDSLEEKVENLLKQTKIDLHNCYHINGDNMKVYFIFDVKKEFINLYKGNERVLYHILRQIYYLEKEEVEYGYNLFNQLINKIPKQDLDRKIFIKYHQDIPYSKRGDTHYINNLYKDEVSRLTIKNSYIKLELEQKTSTFLNILPDFSNNYFICDFKNHNYYFLETKEEQHIHKNYTYLL